MRRQPDDPSMVEDDVGVIVELEPLIARFVE
jgi:hypothetical protein